MSSVSRARDEYLRLISVAPTRPTGLRVRAMLYVSMPLATCHLYRDLILPPGIQPVLGMSVHDGDWDMEVREFCVDTETGEIELWERPDVGLSTFPNDMRRLAESEKRLRTYLEDGWTLTDESARAWIRLRRKFTRERRNK